MPKIPTADLNSLLIFAKVVEANSFSEAANRLDMPVSTVSRRIADLENQLGVRLLERSTRNLRLTDVGAEVFEHAKRGVEVSEAVSNIVSNQLSNISGLLSLSAPPSISDTLLAPLIGAFQAAYPNVRVRVLVTDRIVDHYVEGVDVMFKVGPVKDSALIARTILSYRQQLVASPAYVKKCELPKTPQELLSHPLLAFLHGKPEKIWNFRHVNGTDIETITFTPHLTMNDFSAIAFAAVAGGGIASLPPIVQPQFIQDGRLVEIMPEWRFHTLDLSMARLRSRHVPRPVRVFEEFATQMATTLFPILPN